MSCVRTILQHEASSQNLTQKTSHMLNIPYTFLNGSELISKMTCGAPQLAEIRGKDTATLRTGVKLATWEDECGLILLRFLEHLRKKRERRKDVGQKTRPWNREGIHCPSCGVWHWRTKVGSQWLSLVANRST